MNPYASIWLQPKQTIENFFDSKDKQPLYFLPILIAGASFSINMTPEIGGLYAEDYPAWFSIVLLPLGIGISFLIFAFILPGLTRAFGKIWNGQATMRQMVNAYSLSIIPMLIILIYQVILFASETEPVFENMNSSIEYILRLWTLALLVLGVAKIQGFSYGIALLNVFITYSPFILIALLRQ